MARREPLTILELEFRVAQLDPLRLNDLVVLTHDSWDGGEVSWQTFSSTYLDLKYVERNPGYVVYDIKRRGDGSAT